MKLAIMQPYVFPYIGYFQLVNAVDKFIFYDDVQFIKKGWINRNNILVNGGASSFTIPLHKASQNKLISETETAFTDKWIKQFEATLYFNYKKAPFYKEVVEIIQQNLALRSTTHLIADHAKESVLQVGAYLQLSREFETSSSAYAATRGMEKAARLKSICELNSATDYINAEGGGSLYSKEDFLRSGIRLHFLQPGFMRYDQQIEKYIPGLSIIDVLMFNDVETVRAMLQQYKLT